MGSVQTTIIYQEGDSTCDYSGNTIVSTLQSDIYCISESTARSGKWHIYLQREYQEAKKLVQNKLNKHRESLKIVCKTLKLCQSYNEAFLPRIFTNDTHQISPLNSGLIIGKL